MGIISTLKLEFDTYPPNRIMKLCLLAIALVAGVIAEPESKPWLYPGYGGLYGGYGHYLGKRSADADAEPESKPWLYRGYGGYGLGYGYAGYGGLYGGYGHYLGKRSADAEPESKAESDPYLVGYYPYGNGYALGGLGYYGLGYGYGHLIGKRSADAEPESKPWLTYGYGGYGLGYGLGYGGLYGGYYGTTLESDLLMLSQKASHGWDTVDTDTVDTLDTAAMVSVMVDLDMVGENKPSKSY